MSSYSETFGVESNAVRAAKRYGLCRSDLVETEGGWRFIIPEMRAAADVELPCDVEPPQEWNAIPAVRAATKRAARKAKAPEPVTRQHGLEQEICAMLRKQWMSVPDIMHRTGWQSDSVRRVVGTGARKLGLSAERKRVDGVTSYRIV